MTAAAAFSARCLATARAVSRHGPARVFAVAWATAAALVVATGHAIDLLAAAEAILVLAVVALVVVRMTAAAPPAAQAREPSQRTAAGGARLSRVPPHERTCRFESRVVDGIRLRLWTPAAVALAYAAAVPLVALVSARMPAVALLAIVGQATVPLGAALAAGAGWRELGFDRGHRSLPVALVLLVALAAGAALAGGAVLRGAVAAAPGTLVTAAIPEEVHLRGVLMTRLQRLWGSGWAVVASALVFGAYHATANVGYFGGPPYPVAAALGVVFEGTLGLAFGVLMLRTRSLAAPVAVHAALDAVNFALLPHAQALFH